MISTPYESRIQAEYEERRAADAALDEGDPVDCAECGEEVGTDERDVHERHGRYYCGRCWSDGLADESDRRRDERGER